MHSDSPTGSWRPGREVLLGLVSIVFTIVCYVVLLYDQSARFTQQFLERELGGTTQVIVLTLIIFGFGYAIIVYHVTRLAYFWRLRKSAKRNELTSVAVLEPASVTILIPSYCEEVGVVWQTMMSAALLDYPDRQIVLLLDNPPNPRGSHPRRLLMESRVQAGLIHALFAPISERFVSETEKLRERSSEANADFESLFRRVGELYEEAAHFLESIAARIVDGEFGGPDNHIRRFFIDNILVTPARAHRDHSRSLLEGPRDLKTLDAQLHRLSTMFQFEVDVFERKKFVNLTHAPNKASNLNAYLGLMGGRFNIEADGNDYQLVTAASDVAADFSPRDAEFVVVLDADSFMHPDYLKKTIAVMQAPHNEKVAIAQTPYKAIPGSPSLLERTAGASTDVHFCVAEGMSILHAGSWVGATALVRKAALHDIAEVGEERGFHFPVFIPDKILIEDAHATVRLALRGWRVQHLPEHLNWSATPGDFGALVIQRRRWANGGLLIVPALMQLLRSAPRNKSTFIEGFLRIYHLLAASITAFGGLAILILPFDVTFASAWVGLALLPYLYLHGRDLTRMGYEWFDLFRIFALNIVLLPVVLGGVIKSMEQIFLGTKTPFARTPKIAHRTAVPVVYLLAPLALAACSASYLYEYLLLDLRGQVFPAFWSFIALSYAVISYIRIGPLFVDLMSATSRQLDSALVLGRRWITTTAHVLTGATSHSEGARETALSRKAEHVVAPDSKDS